MEGSGHLGDNSELGLVIQYDWCVPIERGNLNRETCTEESDTKI